MKMFQKNMYKYKDLRALRHDVNFLEGRRLYHLKKSLLTYYNTVGLFYLKTDGIPKITEERGTTAGEEMKIIFKKENLQLVGEY